MSPALAAEISAWLDQLMTLVGTYRAVDGGPSPLPEQEAYRAILRHAAAHPAGRIHVPDRSRGD